MPQEIETPPISPFLWFNDNAEEAVDFYLSVFPNSRRLDVLRSPSQTAVSAGKVLTISFILNGQRFTALNGGPMFRFTEAISFFVRCDTQEEIDMYWSKLTEGGSEMDCGWLKDKYGLCWQIVPANIMHLISTPKGMAAMMTMQKFNIAALEEANRS